MASVIEKTEITTHATGNPFDEILALEAEQDVRMRTATEELEREEKETTNTLVSNKEFKAGKKKEESRGELQLYKETIMPTILEDERRKGEEMCESIDEYCSKQAPKVTSSLVEAFTSLSFLSQN